MGLGTLGAGLLSTFIATPGTRAMGNIGLWLNMMQVDNSAGADAFNLTAVLSIIQQLSPTDRQMLFEQAGINGEYELERLLNSDNMYVKSFDEPVMQYREYRINKLLLLYVPPILIIIGTFGNLFSFVVLRRRPMLKVSTYFYLASLAIADSLVLYIGLLRLWIGELTGVDIQVQANWLCKLTVILGYVSSDTSVWLIMAVTVERFIVVCYPFKATEMCNVPRARWVIFVLICLMFAINLHFLWTVELIETPVDGKNIANCDAVDNHTVLVDEVWPWVDGIIYSFLPFVTILILNILIIRQVLNARGSRERMRSMTERRKLEGGKKQPGEGSTKLTVMLLTVSFNFLITTLPMNVSMIVLAFRGDNNDMHETVQFNLAKTVTELLMYVNHSINFFLYCATGQKFRQQVLQLICHKDPSPSWTSVTEDTNTTSFGRNTRELLLNHKVECSPLNCGRRVMKTRL
ncbi:FMRFamide receptor-like [Haliotis asinina]|uniref:FMRFamide receptor-like n=1 Tax=Haliotis asinina TaxID=109174 RepID=UPI003532727E